MSLKTWATANARHLGYAAAYDGKPPERYPVCAFVLMRKGLTPKQLPNCVTFVLKPPATMKDMWQVAVYENRKLLVGYVPSFVEDPEKTDNHCLECNFSTFPCTVHNDFDKIFYIC